MINLNIVFNGVVYHLNPILIKQNNISEENIKKIKEKYIQNLELFEKMKSENDIKKLKDLAKKVEDIEFELQVLWGFPKNKDFHEWFFVPKCSCPKMDNKEMIGSNFRIINPSCIIHN